MTKYSHNDKYFFNRKDMPFNLFYDFKRTYTYIFHKTTRLINNAGYMEVNNNKMMYFSIFVWLFSRLIYLYILGKTVSMIVNI